MEIMDVFKEMIKPELLVLIPVLYFIGAAVKQTNKIKNEFIPVTLGIIGVIISAIWIFANVEVYNAKEILLGVFAAITQGVLTAGAAVYVNQIIKQRGYIKTENGNTDTGNGENADSEN